MRDRASKTLEESDAQIYLMMGLNPTLYAFLCSQKKTANGGAALNLPAAREFWLHADVDNARWKHFRESAAK